MLDLFFRLTSKIALVLKYTSLGYLISCVSTKSTMILSFNFSSVFQDP